MDALSVVKSSYIIELIGKGEREDSRGMFDFRKLDIKTGLIEQAEGSAQVDLGNTRVLAGVKMVPEEPHSDTPKEGNIIVSAELLPLAAVEYETGPPSPEAIELSRVVDRGIRAANCVDLASLFIEEGKVWSIYVDVYVLNYDGNLFDACTMAAMAALTDTHMPKYSDGAADYKSRDADLPIKNIVTSTTFGKIGNSIVLDTTANEENAMDARLTIQTDGESIRAMQKGLKGSFSMGEIDKLIDISFDKHKEVMLHFKKHRK